MSEFYFLCVPKLRICLCLLARSHWSLLILCHFGETKSKTRTPCMILLDSLHMANPNRLEPEIRKYVLFAISLYNPVTVQHLLV